jgi:hypothetical protein
MLTSFTLFGEKRRIKNGPSIFAKYNNYTKYKQKASIFIEAFKVPRAGLPA